MQKLKPIKFPPLIRIRNSDGIIGYYIDDIKKFLSESNYALLCNWMDGKRVVVTTEDRSLIIESDWRDFLEFAGILIL